MIIILQTSFIVEWHKSVHQKKGVNSLLEHHQHLLQNILKCGGALWRMTPKNYELGGVYNTNNIQCHFFPGGKMAHKQRIVKMNDKSKCQSPSTFLHPILVSQSLCGSKQIPCFHIIHVFDLQLGRIWNWRDIMNEQKKSTYEMLNRQQRPCGFRV